MHSPPGLAGVPHFSCMALPSITVPGDWDEGGKWDCFTPAMDLWDRQTWAAATLGSKQQIPPWKGDFSVQAGPSYC